MKRISLTIINIILLTILVFLITNSSLIIISINETIDLFFKTIIPSLFPILIITDLLINYGLINYLSVILKHPINKLFKLNGEASFVIILSILCGNPTTAKMIKDLYLKSILSEKEATYLLSFTHFINPLFVMGVVNSFINNQKYCYIILFCHYLTNLLIGLFSPLKNKILAVKLHSPHVQVKSLGSILTSSIISSINTLLLIFGTITCFGIIYTIINQMMMPNIYLRSIIQSILEITLGIKAIALLNLNIVIKCSLIGFFISFGGLAINMQVLSIISDTKIKYLPFLISRLIQGFICFSFIYFILSYWQ